MSIANLKCYGSGSFLSEIVSHKPDGWHATDTKALIQRNESLVFTWMGCFTYEPAASVLLEQTLLLCGLIDMYVLIHLDCGILKYLECQVSHVFVYP